MKDRIEQALNTLVDMKLTDIGRSADLEWFVFRSIPLPVSARESNLQYSEYTLHAECAWRIVGSEGIVVGSRDRYYPAGVDPYKDLMEFNWDVPGSNRCDERANKFIKSRSEKLLIVLSVEADHVGSLCIKLSDGYRIELFPDDSLGGEYWRFFKLNSDTHHFVVTGKGIGE